MRIEVAVFHGNQGFKQVRGHLIEFYQDAVFKVLRVQPADQQRLQANHGQFRAIGSTQPGNVIARETYLNRLGLLQPFIELEATGIDIDGITTDSSGTRPIGDALAPIAQGIKLDKEVVLAEFLADEQLQRPGIYLGRDRPALAREFLLDYRIEINRKAREHDETDKAELQSPAQQGARTARGTFFGGTGRLGTSHGRGLYALYCSSTGALRRFARGPLVAIMGA